MSSEAMEDVPRFENLMEVFHARLDEMLGDPLLCDLHQQITLDEIRSLTSLEHGQAMTVKVCRADGDSYPVIVKQDVSVSGFKKAIRHHVDLQQSRKGSLLRISWRHVWKRYWLVYCGVKLKDDNKLLRDYDIRNRDEVHFIPRLRE